MINESITELWRLRSLRGYSVPRGEVSWVDANLNIAEIRRRFSLPHYRLFPVCSGRARMAGYRYRSAASCGGWKGADVATLAQRLYRR